MSSVVRIPDQTHLEAKRIAALRGQQPGEVLAEAWREYLARNGDRFAADLERAATLLREGTLEDLAAFASRHANEHAEQAAARIRAGE